MADPERERRHAMFNKWRDTPAGQLFCNLTLSYAPLPVHVQFASDSVNLDRVYVGGVPHKLWFFVEKPTEGNMPEHSAHCYATMLKAQSVC